MILEKHKLSLDSFECRSNYVLVKPDKRENHLKDDFNFSVDTSFEPGMHAPRTGTVVKVPKNLYFHPSRYANDSMPWDTDMELKIGDHVTYHYLSGWSAEERFTETCLIFDDEVYYLIKYNRIFTAKRKIYNNTPPIVLDKIICLNGYVLIEPVKDLSLEKYNSLLEIPQLMDKRFGIIRYIGSLIKDYGTIYKNYFGPDQDNLTPGDVVMMDKACDIPLEFPLHAMLEGDKIFYRVQRRYVLGKMVY